jgi:hypothetical protein
MQGCERSTMKGVAEVRCAESEEEAMDRHLIYLRETRAVNSASESAKKLSADKQVVILQPQNRIGRCSTKSVNMKCGRDFGATYHRSSSRLPGPLVLTAKMTMEAH